MFGFRTINQTEKKVRAPNHHKIWINM